MNNATTTCTYTYIDDPVSGNPVDTASTCSTAYATSTVQIGLVSDVPTYNDWLIVSCVVIALLAVSSCMMVFSLVRPKKVK
jgi:hypothetical protein